VACHRHGSGAAKGSANRDSKQIPVLKKQGKDVGALMAEMKALSEKIGMLDVKAVKSKPKSTRCF
jgi:seryl-tRNA synthetase